MILGEQDQSLFGHGEVPKVNEHERIVVYFRQEISQLEQLQRDVMDPYILNSLAQRWLVS